MAGGARFYGALGQNYPDSLRGPQARSWVCRRSQPVGWRLTLTLAPTACASEHCCLCAPPPRPRVGAHAPL